MVCRQPVSRSIKVPLKQLKSEADQSRKPDQAIGLVWMKALGFLPAGEGPGRDLKQLRNPRERKIQHPSQPFQGFVGETVLQS